MTVSASPRKQHVFDEHRQQHAPGRHAGPGCCGDPAGLAESPGNAAVTDPGAGPARAEASAALLTETPPQG